MEPMSLASPRFVVERFIAGSLKEAVAMNRSTTNMMLLFLLASMLCSCATPEQATRRGQVRSAAAKDLFDQTTKLYHLPSAQAQGDEKAKLLAQAAEGYRQLLRHYPDQPAWCAQALRSLGNVRAEQGRLDEAVKLYSCVATKYPGQDWEVLQAWKSAADLLWEADRRDQARVFYRNIVTRYDVADAPAVVKTIVRASKAHLN